MDPLSLVERASGLLVLKEEKGNVPPNFKISSPRYCALRILLDLNLSDLTVVC